ncbi:ribonuclease P protein component [Patescibacteria group bacterium]|nr:MAG: ribonuclease P protein component [Patescibacteria group bacterium]
MLQQENRLRKKRDFDLVLKHGHWMSGRILALKYVELAKIRDYFPKKEDPDNFEKQLKLAIVVGVKVSKSAVKRNRARRQMRETVRLLIKAGRIKVGYYIMVVAKNGVLGANYADISQEVESLLRKIKVLS